MLNLIKVTAKLKVSIWYLSLTQSILYFFILIFKFFKKSIKFIIKFLKNAIDSILKNLLSINLSNKKLKVGNFD